MCCDMTAAEMPVNVPRSHAFFACLALKGCKEIQRLCTLSVQSPIGIHASRENISLFCLLQNLEHCGSQRSGVLFKECLSQAPPFLDFFDPLAHGLTVLGCSDLREHLLHSLGPR